MKFNIIIILIFALYSLIAIFSSVEEIPDVYKSYSTNKCTKVINYTSDEFTCNNLPKKYNLIWVK